MIEYPRDNSGIGDATDTTNSVGVVVIGRNEGERLRRCLESVIGRVKQVVYVDSGSTDGSVGRADEKGAVVVRLDMSVPFTAARARNAGYHRLVALQPDIRFVQFVDGDCEIADSWIETAVAMLNDHSDVVVVCGRRRERMSDQSIYNRLMDMEWNTPLGEVDACGGDALMRSSAFGRVNGFNPDMIAGEEPELCVRLREAGGRILRIDADMTFHDAAMTHFSQWWRRSTRNGYAYALGADLHRHSETRHWVRDTRRIWLWGGILPLLIAALAPPTSGASLVAFVVYPAWSLRIARQRRRSFGDNMPHALLYGCFCMLAKFPQLVGQVRYHWDRLRGRCSGLIEYK